MRILITFSLLVLTEIVAAQTFPEVAAVLGIDHHYGLGSAGGGVSFYDFNQDGWDDLTFASHSGDSIYFFENRQGVFIKVPSFVTNFCESKQILWVDYDNDGDKDLFVSCYLAANRLYNNNGKMVFTDVTEQSGLPLSSEKTFGVAWADYDNDGWLDLYITNKPEGTGSSSNQLYRNVENGSFIETTSVAGVADVGKKPFSVSFLDYNNDGAADIYIAQDKKAVNTFLENNGDGSYDDVSVDSKSDLSMEGMCVAVGDYDSDGYQDIYISNISEGNRLLKNNGNETFSEVSENTGVAYHGIGWGSNFLDYDNDCDLDLYVSGSLEGSDQVPSIMYTNNGAGNFENTDVGFAGDTVISFSNAIGDIDNDGYPDVAVNNFDEYPSMVWRNTGGTNNWIKIQLQGVQSNRDGIGTSIRAYFDNRNIIRYTHCGIGFLAQN
ncbi:MAG: FG-GAP repeat domain-containing protein, partial [Cyclobacteriaceae bacterium]